MHDGVAKKNTIGHSEQQPHQFGARLGCETIEDKMTPYLVTVQNEIDENNHGFKRDVGINHGVTLFAMFHAVFDMLPNS